MGKPKTTKRKFNDDYYCKTVEEWEDETVPDMLLSKRIEWALRVAGPVLLIGIVVARGDWGRWLVLLAGFYLLVVLFTFLEEINENLRFVRHQLRTYREAFKVMNAEVATYRDGSGFTLADFVDRVDREWLP